MEKEFYESNKQLKEAERKLQHAESIFNIAQAKLTSESSFSQVRMQNAKEKLEQAKKYYIESKSHKNMAQEKLQKEILEQNRKHDRNKRLKTVQETFSKDLANLLNKSSEHQSSTTSYKRVIFKP